MRWRARTIVQLHYALRATRPQLKRDPLGSVTPTGLFLIVLAPAHVSQEFWANFWPNFWADLVVGIVIAGGISWILAKSKKINASVSGRLRKVGPTEFELQLSIKNSGKVNFKENEIFAHILVNNVLVPTILQGNARQSPVTLLEKPYSDFVYLMPLPCFPDRMTDLFSIRLQSSSIGEKDILYFLSTAYGFFPKGIRVAEDGSVNGLGVVPIARIDAA